MQRDAEQLAAPATPIPSFAAVLTSTNRAVKVSLAWDASPQHAIVTNYTVHWGGASNDYTNRVNAGTNLSVTVSNLAPGTRYYFAANAQTRWSGESALSAEIFWPQPFTNYVTVGIKTNNRVIVQLVYANPPGDVVLFEPFISLTNDAVSVLRLPTGNLIVGNTNTP